MTEYSKKQVRRAGCLFRDVAHGDEEFDTTKFMAAVEVVDWWRGQHAKQLSRTNALLRYHIRQVGVEPQVTQRLKRFSTIVDKLFRHPTMQLDTMEDIAGVRAVLPDQADVDALVRRLRAQRRWEIRRTRQYVSGRHPGPKEDGYRAVHLTIVREGRYVEIQLRTPWQDAWAQSVEQDTRRLGERLKFGAGPADLRDYYRLVAELLEAREMNQVPSEQLLEDLARFRALTRHYYAEGER